MLNQDFSLTPFSLRLELSGHTDNTADKGHNLKLSQARAQAVVQVLVAKYGIDA